MCPNRWGLFRAWLLSERARAATTERPVKSFEQGLQ